MKIVRPGLAAQTDSPLMKDQETQQKLDDLSTWVVWVTPGIFTTDPASEKLHHAETDERCRNGAEMVRFSPRTVQKFESRLLDRVGFIAPGCNSPIPGDRFFR